MPASRATGPVSPTRSLAGSRSNAPPDGRSAVGGSVAARGSIWTLVRTDFKARYHGTLGGFVWALLKPLTMFVVLMGVFSFLFASDPTYKLNLIVGLFLWDFFAEGTKTGLTSLHAKGYLLTQGAAFPSWILVVTSISNAVITLAVFSLVIVVFSVAVGPAAGAGRAGRCSPRYCVALVAIVVGFSLATSVLFLRYRDLNQVWDVVVRRLLLRADHLSARDPPRALSLLPVPLAADAGHRVLARRARRGVVPTLPRPPVSGVDGDGRAWSSGVLLFRATARARRSTL